MYVLYGGRFTRAVGPQMVLEEAGLDYELRDVDIVTDEHLSSEFRALNPAGYVPALVTPEGNVLHEASGIMLYLADRHCMGDLVPGVDTPERGVFYSKFFFLTNDIQPAMKRYYYPHRFSSDPADADRIKAQAYDIAMERWSVIESHLAANGPYYLGDQISIADFFMAMWVAFGFEGPHSLLDDYPAIRRCYQLVRERPRLTSLLAEIEGSFDSYLLAKGQS